jgi:hypothetical protein
VNVAPLGDGLFGAVTTASCAGAAALTVAVNVTGLPLAPASVAVTVADPTAVGSVQAFTWAMPLEFVVAVSELLGGALFAPTVIVPPATVNVTPMPATGFCAASRTMTAGKLADGTALPAAPLSVVETLGAIEATAPAEIVTCAVVDVTPADAKVIVTGPTGPLTPRPLNVAVPVVAVVALPDPTKV